jgi:cyclase
MLNSIDRDGTMNGYDLELVEKISSALKIPVIVCGGAGNTEHFKSALRKGASACAAGSMFVFKSHLRGILMNYLSPDDIQELISAKKQ